MYVMLMPSFLTCEMIVTLTLWPAADTSQSYRCSRKGDEKW
jgi:hypothetical protein